MKFVVPLRMPSSDLIWLADRHWLMLAMIGMPPATEASNAIERPSSRARSNSSGPCSASSALFAVTTSLPLSSSRSMIVRSGSRPPISCATTLISGLLITSSTLSVSTPFGRSQSRAFLRSRTTAFSSHSVRPAWRAVRSPWSSSSFATPCPTVPKPMIATFVFSIELTPGSVELSAESAGAEPATMRLHPSPRRSAWCSSRRVVSEYSMSNHTNLAARVEQISPRQPSRCRLGRTPCRRHRADLGNSRRPCRASPARLRPFIHCDADHRDARFAKRFDHIWPKVGKLLARHPPIALPEHHDRRLLAEQIGELRRRSPPNLRQFDRRHRVANLHLAQRFVLSTTATVGIFGRPSYRPGKTTCTCCRRLAWFRGWRRFDCGSFFAGGYQLRTVAVGVSSACRLRVVLRSALRLAARRRLPFV